MTVVIRMTTIRLTRIITMRIKDSNGNGKYTTTITTIVMTIM